MRQAATLTKSVTSKIRYKANDQVKMADIGQGELENKRSADLVATALEQLQVKFRW